MGLDVGQQAAFPAIGQNIRNLTEFGDALAACSRRRLQTGLAKLNVYLGNGAELSNILLCIYNRIQIGDYFEDLAVAKWKLMGPKFHLSLCLRQFYEIPTQQNTI